MPEETDKIGELVEKVKHLPLHEKLQLAARLLIDAEVEGGNTQKARLAHTLSRSVADALGAVLALHDLKASGHGERIVSDDKPKGANIDDSEEDERLRLGKGVVGAGGRGR